MSLPKCFQHQLKLTSKHFTNDTSENHHLSFETSRYMRIVCSFEIRKPEMDCSWERNAFACVSCTVLIFVLSVTWLKIYGNFENSIFLHCFFFVPTLTINVDAVSVGVGTVGMVSSVRHGAIGDLALLCRGLLHRGDVQVKLLCNRGREKVIVNNYNLRQDAFFKFLPCAPETCG